jgi:hypothetical protein
VGSTGGTAPATPDSRAAGCPTCVCGVMSMDATTSFVLPSQHGAGMAWDFHTPRLFVWVPSSTLGFPVPTKTLSSIERQIL